MAGCEKNAGIRLQNCHFKVSHIRAEAIYIAPPHNFKLVISDQSSLPALLA